MNARAPGPRGDASWLQSTAIAVAQAVRDEAYYVQRGEGLRKTPEKKIRQRIDELNEIKMLLVQIGWR